MLARLLPRSRGPVSRWRSRSLLVAFFFLLVLSSLPTLAVDTPSGAPEYLERTLRPRWRLEPVEVAFAEIERVIDRPVQVSWAIEELGIEVILIERKKLTVRQVLELLEENYDLHCIAEPLRVVVETKDEERGRRRRPVNLDLRDYGLFFRAPRSLSPVGIGSNDSDDDGVGSPFDFGSDEEEDGDLPFEIRSLLEELGGNDGDSGESLRGTGALLLRLTPEEEDSIRSVLEDLARARLARTEWRVHFGLLPGSAETRGGVVSGADARTVAEALIEPERLLLSAVAGDLAFARAGATVRTVTDLEVNQTGPFPVLNPVTATPLAGNSAQMKVLVGVEHHLLSYDVQWRGFVGEVKSSEVRTPAVIQGGWTSAEVKKDGTAEATQRQPERIPGSIQRFEDRPIGRWDSIGEAFVPHGSGLILLGTVEGRSAAVVFEEVTQ